MCPILFMHPYGSILCNKKWMHVYATTVNSRNLVGTSPSCDLVLKDLEYTSVLNVRQYNDPACTVK